MDKLNIRYSEILQNLKKSARYQKSIDQELKSQIIQALESSIKEDQLKALCCLQNTYTYSKDFQPSLMLVLENSNDEEIMVHSLIASIKQVIEFSQKRGERIPGEWIMLFKKFLSKGTPPEVLLWCLRLIQSMGSQRLFYKNDLVQLKPSWIQTKLSQKQKEISILIEPITNF